jgi:hypothetical protein
MFSQLKQDEKNNCIESTRRHFVAAFTFSRVLEAEGS